MLKEVAVPAVVGLLLATASISLAEERSTEEAKPVQAVQFGSGSPWEGSQQVAADQKGRVFILRAETLDVYPVEDGELGEPRALEGAGIGAPDPLLDAAMDGHGDWVLLEGFQVRWFRSGEEKIIPQPPWLPRSVEILDGRPIVSVVPLAIQRNLRSKTPPRVVAYDGDSWYSLVDSDMRRPSNMEDGLRMRDEETTHSLVASDETLWLANLYRYKVTRYSAAGRELLSIESDGAKIAHRDESELEKQRFKLEEERARHANPGKAKIHINPAIPVIRAITEGWDGHMYLLVRDKDGTLVLDRLDTVQGLIARVPTNITTPAAIYMAAGKDGLYFVPYSGQEKRWFIPWESLETADWMPLEGVEGLAPAFEEARERS